MSLFSFKKSELDKKRDELEHLKGQISADAKLAEVEQEISTAVIEKEQDSAVANEAKVAKEAAAAAKE